MQWGKRPDYENVPKEHRQFMKVQPVNFNQEHKEMLGHCKMLLEQGYIAINPDFDKLITSLRTAVAEENILDKECTSYADVFFLYLCRTKFMLNQLCSDIFFSFLFFQIPVIILTTQE